MSLCASCGKNMDIVGKAHRCVPSPVVVIPATQGKIVVTGDGLIPDAEYRGKVNNAASPNVSPNTAYARNARWRQENPETYRAGQRDLMRARRAREKANV